MIYNCAVTSFKHLWFEVFEAFNEMEMSIMVIIIYLKIKEVS